MRGSGKVVASGMVALLTSIGVSAAAAPAPAEAGQSFGSGGTVVTDFGGNDAANDLLLTPNGKVVVVGTSGDSGVVARYLRNGRLDRTFSRDGKVKLTGYAAYSVARQPDGKIVVAGEALGSRTGTGVVRITRAGRLDRTFSRDGRFVHDDYGDVTDVAVQPNGKILVLGAYLLRLTRAGKLDPKFAQPSVNPDNERYHGLARQSTGGYVMAAYDDCTHAFVRRYTPSGQRDAGFGSATGTAAGASAFGLHVLSGDKVFVASNGRSDDHCDFTPGLTFEQYLPGGRHDPSYGSDGLRFVDISGWPAAGSESPFRGSALAPGGTILLMRGANLVRVDRSTGALDTSFGTGGILTLGPLSAHAVAVRPDGKVLVAGTQGSDVAVRQIGR